MLESDPGRSTINADNALGDTDAARHQDLASIGGRSDGGEARGLYVNNFLLFPNGL